MKHIITTAIILSWGIIIIGMFYLTGSVFLHYFGRPEMKGTITAVIVGAGFCIFVISVIGFAVMVVCGIHDAYFWIYNKLK